MHWLYITQCGWVSGWVSADFKKVNITSTWHNPQHWLPDIIRPIEQSRGYSQLYFSLTGWSTLCALPWDKSVKSVWQGGKTSKKLNILIIWGKIVIFEHLCGRVYYRSDKIKYGFICIPVIFFCIKVFLHILKKFKLFRLSRNLGLSIMRKA